MIPEYSVLLEADSLVERREKVLQICFSNEGAEETANSEYGYIRALLPSAVKQNPEAFVHWLNYKNRIKIDILKGLDSHVYEAMRLFEDIDINSFWAEHNHKLNSTGLSLIFNLAGLFNNMDEETALSMLHVLTKDDTLVPININSVFYFSFSEKSQQDPRFKYFLDKLKTYPLTNPRQRDYGGLGEYKLLNLLLNKPEDTSTVLEDLIIFESASSYISSTRKINYDHKDWLIKNIPIRKGQKTFFSYTDFASLITNCSLDDDKRAQVIKVYKAEHERFNDGMFMYRMPSYLLRSDEWRNLIKLYPKLVKTVDWIFTKEGDFLPDSSIDKMRNKGSLEFVNRLFNRSVNKSPSEYFNNLYNLLILHHNHWEFFSSSQRGIFRRLMVKNLHDEAFYKVDPDVPIAWAIDLARAYVLEKGIKK